jgi:hypothetical protein
MKPEYSKPKIDCRILSLINHLLKDSKAVYAVVRLSF